VLDPLEAGGCAPLLLGEGGEAGALEDGAAGGAASGGLAVDPEFEGCGAIVSEPDVDGGFVGSFLLHPARPSASNMAIKAVCFMSSLLKKNYRNAGCRYSATLAASANLLNAALTVAEGRG
jgi:hypothetical protein